MSKLFIAVSALIGTIVGAGVLGIPYVVMRSGFVIGLANMVLVAVIVAITLLYLGEIGLRTKTNHHLPGYASLYLGKKGKYIMLFSLAFGIASALIAYLIGEGESFSYLFFNSTSYSLHFGIAFWFILSAMTYFGLKAMEKGEVLGMSAILALIVLILALNWNKINIDNLTYNNPQFFFVPFGVVLFAFLGFSAIPEIERMLGKDKHLTKKTILLSSLIVFIIYVIFTAVVIGINGTATPHLATLTLGKIFIILGILTMFTSYLALSLALIDSLRFDFSFSRKKAWLITTLTPLIIFVLLNFFNIASFIKVLGIGGTISGGIAGILILFMVKNAKKQGNRKPEYSIPYSRFLVWLISIIFSLGIILEVASSF